MRLTLDSVTSVVSPGGNAITHGQPAARAVGSARVSSCKLQGDTSLWKMQACFTIDSVTERELRLSGRFYFFCLVLSSCSLRTPREHPGKFSKACFSDKAGFPIIYSSLVNQASLSRKCWSYQTWSTVWRPRNDTPVTKEKELLVPKLVQTRNSKPMFYTWAPPRRKRTQFTYYINRNSSGFGSGRERRSNRLMPLKAKVFKPFISTPRERWCHYRPSPSFFYNLPPINYAFLVSQFWIFDLDCSHWIPGLGRTSGNQKRFQSSLFQTLLKQKFYILLCCVLPTKTQMRF